MYVPSGILDSEAVAFATMGTRYFFLHLAFPSQWARHKAKNKNAGSTVSADKIVRFILFSCLCVWNTLFNEIIRQHDVHIMPLAN